MPEPQEHTLFWRSWGPRVAYDGAALIIEDLNPEIKTKWVLTTDELVQLGQAIVEAGLTGVKVQNA